MTKMYPRLRMAGIPVRPWSIITTINNKTTYEGAVFDIYDGMKRSMNLDYDYDIITSYGGKTDGNKWTGKLGSLTRNETDIIGPIFLNEDRLAVVDYATPFFISKVSIVSGLVAVDKHPFLIFGIFSLKVWVLLLITVLMCSGAACLIYSLVPSTERKRKVSQALLRYLWSFSVTIIGKEFGGRSRWFLRHIWQAPSFCFLQGIWLLGCLVLMYTLQGTIVSTYAADRMKPRIQTLEELIDDTNIKVGAFTKSYPLKCLSGMVNTKYHALFLRAQDNLENLTLDDSVPAWLDDIEDGKLVHLTEFMYSQFIIGERFKKRGLCNIRMTPIDMCSSYLALAFRKTFPKPLFSKFNEKVMHFNQGGLNERRMMETVLFYDICTQNSRPSTKPLNLTDLTAAFTVLGTGLATSFLAFIYEVTLNLKCNQLKLN